MAAYDLIAVYIVASKRNGTLYLGVTSDLLQRGLDHREGRFTGFSKKYGCKTLVWWEQHYDLNLAIKRETQMKGWKRAWKLALIEKTIRRGVICTRIFCFRTIYATGRMFDRARSPWVPGLRFASPGMTEGGGCAKP